METRQRSMILGFHDVSPLEDYIALFEYNKYKVDIADSLDKMKEMLQEKQYDVCLMDGNFGSRGSQDPTSSQVIYNGFFKKRVENGKAIFRALSNSDVTVKNAQELGIPSEPKPVSESLYNQIIDFYP